MIERFNDIREALIEVADSDDSELVIDRRVSLKKKNCQNNAKTTRRDQYGHY